MKMKKTNRRRCSDAAERGPGGRPGDRALPGRAECEPSESEYLQKLLLNIFKTVETQKEKEEEEAVVQFACVLVPSGGQKSGVHLMFSTTSFALFKQNCLSTRTQLSGIATTTTTTTII